MEEASTQALSTLPLADTLDQQDHLSALPSELLDIIFNDVRLANGEKQLLGLVSKRLLPFTRSTLYRNVTVTSQTQLARLCRTLADNPALGKVVQTLEVAFAAKEEEPVGGAEDGTAAAEDGAEETQDSQTDKQDKAETMDAPLEVDDAEMLRLLQSLPRLSCLGVRHSAMAQLVISDAFTMDHGKSLGEIRLSFADTPTADALRPLGHLPVLSRLSLLIDAKPEALLEPGNPWDVEPESLFSDFAIRNVQHLRLGGSFIGPGLPVLSLLFPNAKEVQMHAMPWDLVTTPIYSFLPSAHLTDLTIVQSPLVIEGRAMPVRSFSDSFSRFSNLTYLFLDTAADLTPLFPHLASPLPLEYLIFGENSRPKVAQLKPLLLGPRKLADLRVLEVNSVPSGQSGNPLNPLDADGLEELEKVIQARQDGEQEAAFCDWVLPDWYEGLTSADAEDLLRSTSESETLVEGTFIEALIHERILGQQVEIARGERPALTEEEIGSVPGPAPREAKESAYWAMAGLMYVTNLMGTRGRKTLQEILGVEGIDVEVPGVGDVASLLV
ncbi:hypothetical protein BCR35DRAFT_349521 [Leucosporidium creatinivorum]|uniref:F-box domain-containing protein n=1 Tax=Leucosporidium creatinivorum TaxID=106004 RepID=A0A1Y2G301_9BASI|nr:hypothetical protein BCR35DRAFT_349521 [Leucosporidium creatinivorum]